MTRLAALYRYLDGSWLFAISVLAGFAIDDLASELAGVRRVQAALCGVGIVLVALGLFSWSKGVSSSGSVALAICSLQALVIVIIIGLAWTRPSLCAKQRAGLIATAAATEIPALFAVPAASHPRSTPVELGGVQFLQQQLGLQRFVTPGPIAANYGSFFGIAQVNHNDLQVPHDWVAYARRHLDPHIDPIVLSPSSPAALLAHLPDYAAIGTGFVIAPADTPLPGPVLRYADRAMRIYQLPGGRPYFTAPSCTIGQIDRTELTVACARPSRLARLELFIPGWSATVNGRAAPVLRTGEIFQAVDLPAGRARVIFRYRPPYLAGALALGGLGSVDSKDSHFG